MEMPTGNQSFHTNNSDDEDLGTLGSFESESDQGVFFADAILDLEDAHDLADDEDTEDGVIHSLTDQDAKPSSNNETISTGRIGSSVEMRNLSTINTNNSSHSTSRGNSNVANNNPGNYGRVSNANTQNTPALTPAVLAPRFRPRLPRHLRDRTYTLAFLLFVPFSLFLSRILSQVSSPYYDDDNTNIHIRGWTHAASSPQASPYTHIPLFLSTALVIFAARFMYKIPGGGEGENARYSLSAIFNQSSTIALVSHVLLFLQIYFLTPRAWMYGLFPIFWFMIDVFVRRELCLIGRASSLSVSSTGVGSSDSEMAGRRGIWGSLLPGRRVFFQAMLDVSLDILSRSLRRAVFMRVIMVTLAVQGFFLILWVGSFWRVLGLDLNPMGKCLTVFLVIVGGWWTCAFFSRVLGLIASGGITSWFANHNVVLLDSPEIHNNPQQQNRASDSHSDTASDDYSVGYNNDSDFTRNGFSNNIQDAYRTADASAYSSVRDYDEGIEDDYPQEDEFDHGPQHAQIMANSNETDWTTNTNVKSFLVSALTISSGSVIKCALMGSFAQCVHFCLRNIDGLSFPSFGRQRPMNISSSLDSSNFSSGLKQRLVNALRRVQIKARSFVHSHSEYGMCHIAAYYKPYQKASSDVSSLISISGVEPILHDDITHTMCSTLASAITGWMSIFFFFSLAHHRGGSDSALSFRLSDANVCQIILVQYCICYLMLLTLLEPLRASIQAIYVAFAQCPESMSHAFPLVFHRLRRIAEGGVSNRNEGNIV